MKNLDLIDKLQEELGVSRKIVLGRELTKMFEEIVRGEVEEVEKYYEENGDKVKGEIVVLVW
jgi:16S rRNA (cytidine1402-2'-O)-methyltransferase